MESLGAVVGNLSTLAPVPTPAPSFRKAKSTPGQPAQTPAPEREGSSFRKSSTAGQTPAPEREGSSFRKSSTTGQTPSPEREGSFRKSSGPGQTPGPVEREESFRSAKSSTPATQSRASAAKSYDNLLRSRSKSLKESSAKEKAGVRAPIIMVDPPTEIFVCTVRVKLSESLDLTSQAKGFLNPGVRVAVRRRDEVPTRPPTRRILIAIPNAVTTLGWINATKDDVETLKEPPPEEPSPEESSPDDAEEQKDAASLSPVPPALAVEQKPQETVMLPQSPDTISAILPESPPTAGARSVLEMAGLPRTPPPPLDLQRSLAGETSAMSAASAGASSNRRRIQSADLPSVSQLSRRVLNRSNSSSFNNGAQSQSSSFNTGSRSRSQSSSFNGSSRNQQEPPTRLQRSRSLEVFEAVL